MQRVILSWFGRVLVQLSLAPLLPVSLLLVATIANAQNLMSSSSSPATVDDLIPGPSLLSAPGPAVSAGARLARVTKSENDLRDYRYLTLSNGLRVLLVADASAAKSAAALNVYVGSHQNPKQRPGLAHFLEHMLFLGTEKYPEAGSYQDFISQHGGENNAYTAEENTSYFFDIEHGYLDPALDRFAQFFIAPLFSATYVEQEKNAVNAEFLAKLNDDDRREWDVIRNLINPLHPASGFSVGNLGTFEDREGQGVRDDLLSFYKSFYSANLMTLTVIGNQKLDDLQKMVESRFAQIPNRNKIIDENYPSLFLPSVLPASLSIKPVKEFRQLRVIFPVPSYARHYQTKPWDYFAHLLGNESGGSLLALLKNLGWAESLRAGVLMQGRSDAMFEVSIGLTKSGVKAKDQIVSALFDYIKLIGAQGVVEWRFREQQQIADVEFRFREHQSALDTATELAQAMQLYPAQDVLSGPFIYSNYDQDLLKQAFSYLRQNNALITMTAPEVETALVSDYYKSAYRLQSGIPEVLDLKPSYHAKLYLPERNIFIPRNLAVKAPSMLPAGVGNPAKNVPSLLVDTDLLKLWFLQDKLFRSPKAELNFRFKLPVLNGSLENAARMQLYAALMLDQLNEFAYPAGLAGLSFDVKANPRGFDVKVAGYTDKQSLLVNKIVLAIAQSEFAEDRFEKLKEDQIREWRNDDKNMPYSVLARKIARLQFLTWWAPREYADALQKTSYAQFKQFTSDMLRGARIDALFYGNLYPQDAIKISALVEHQLLQKRSSRLPQLVKVLRSENANNKSWLYTYPVEHDDHVVELYIQALSPAVEDAAHMLLLGQILQSPFYTQLRTEKQLGYVVDVFPMPFKSIEGNVFVVQSPGSSAEQLMQEINNFLSKAPATIAENFSDNKHALLAQLREPAISLSEQSDKYWQSILLGDLEFTRQQDLIAAVNKITLDSVQKYYQSAFLQKNRRLWLSTEKFESMAGFELIQQLTDYQQKQKGYLYP
jgi:insulysin